MYKNIKIINNYTYIINYMEEKILILSHLGLGDNIFCISMINYYLKNNFIVHYVCKKHNLINFQLFFEKNQNLKFIDVNNDKEAHLFIQENQKKYKRILKSVLHTINSKLYNFPFFQYDDIGLERNILHLCTFKTPTCQH